jgi:hypothetical protein
MFTGRLGLPCSQLGKFSLGSPEVCKKEEVVDASLEVSVYVTIKQYVAIFVQNSIILKNKLASKAIFIRDNYRSLYTKINSFSAELTSNIKTIWK